MSLSNTLKKLVLTWNLQSKKSCSVEKLLTFFGDKALSVGHILSQGLKGLPFVAAKDSCSNKRLQP